MKQMKNIILRQLTTLTFQFLIFSYFISIFMYTLYYIYICKYAALYEPKE